MRSTLRVARSTRCWPRTTRSPRGPGVPAGTPVSAGDEVLRAWVMADERRGGLLGLVLPTRFFVALDTDVLGAQQLGDLGVVFEIGAGGIAPRIAPTAILLAEQAGQRRPVHVGEAPLLADAMVPVLGQRLGHLDPQTVQQQIVLVLVGDDHIG